MPKPPAWMDLSLWDSAVVDSLTKEDPMAIHKLLAFSILRQSYNKRVIHFKNLRKRCPLDQSFTSSRSSAPHGEETVPTSPLADFGQLRKLPTEILQAIFETLDLQTVTYLRSVNRRAMSLVDSTPLYREIYTHCPDVLRAMLSTRIARHFNLWQVSRELRSEDCYLCGDFGAFLVLPSCSRCCWLCLTSAEDTLPISKAQAKESFELTNNALAHMPAMLSLPGDYGYVTEGPTTHIRRVWLVSLWAARSAARELHGLARISEAHMDQQAAFWISAYDRQEPRIAKPPFYPYIRGRLASGCEKRRFMTAIRLPTLDTTTGIREWGVSCFGCLRGRREGRPDQRMYTRRGLLEHGQNCELAQKRWASYKSLDICTQLDSRLFDTEILDARGIKWTRDEVRIFQSFENSSASNQSERTK